MSSHDIVYAWFRTRLASGRLARDTELYNQVFGALPDLIEQLDAAPTSSEPDVAGEVAKASEVAALEKAPSKTPAPDAPASA